jgi:hypothetical protein
MAFSNHASNHANNLRDNSSHQNNKEPPMDFDDDIPF